jgi:hypothetical protein
MIVSLYRVLPIAGVKTRVAHCGERKGGGVGIQLKLDISTVARASKANRLGVKVRHVWHVVIAIVDIGKIMILILVV